MNKIEEIKGKYQPLLEGRYTNEFMERRMKYIDDCMNSNIHVVSDGNRLDEESGELVTRGE